MSQGRNILPLAALKQTCTVAVGGLYSRNIFNNLDRFVFRLLEWFESACWRCTMCCWYLGGIRVAGDMRLLCPQDNVKWRLTCISDFCLRPPTDRLFSKVKRLFWSVSSVVSCWERCPNWRLLHFGSQKNPSPCCTCIFETWLLVYILEVNVYLCI